MAGFYNPIWLLGLLCLPVLYYLQHRATQKRKVEAMAFSRVAVMQSALAGGKRPKRPLVLLLLGLAGLGLIFIGLADPHIPLDQTRQGANVVFVIDVSGSMQATDYTPSRLEAAKQAAGTLLSQLDPNDNAGIVVFESGATTAAYMSPDKDRVMEKLMKIAPRTGQTAMGDGLALAVDMVQSQPSTQKVVILLSDGVNNAGVISPDEAIGFAQAAGIQVFTVGLGSPQPVILGYDWAGNPYYAEVDEDTLKLIATKTGGRYYQSVDSRTLSEIYAGLGDQITREPVETSIRVLFFVGAIVLLLAEFSLRYGRGRIIP